MKMIHVDFFLRFRLLHHDRLNCNPIWVSYIFSLIFKRLKSQWSIKCDTADASYVKWIQMNEAIFWILLCNHAEVCKINEAAWAQRWKSWSRSFRSFWCFLFMCSAGGKFGFSVCELFSRPQCILVHKTTRFAPD